MDRALQFYCDLLGSKNLLATGWAAGTDEAISRMLPQQPPMPLE
jgi:hypothetical protein